MNLDRLDAATILGARVWIVAIGQTITGGSGENNTVSDAVIPELPESYANPGDWLTLGKVRTAKPQTDYKTADVEGVDDTGAYKVTEMKLAQKRKLQFSTNDITPEAFQMTFGLTSAIVDGEEQAVFASGNDSLEVCPLRLRELRSVILSQKFRHDICRSHFQIWFSLMLHHYVFSLS